MHERSFIWVMGTIVANILVTLVMLLWAHSLLPFLISTCLPWFVHFFHFFGEVKILRFDPGCVQFFPFKLWLWDVEAGAQKSWLISCSKIILFSTFWYEWFEILNQVWLCPNWGLRPFKLSRILIYQWAYVIPKRTRSVIKFNWCSVQWLDLRIHILYFLGLAWLQGLNSTSFLWILIFDSRSTLGHRSPTENFGLYMCGSLVFRLVCAREV